MRRCLLSATDRGHQGCNAGVFSPAAPNVNQFTHVQSSGRQGQNQTQTPQGSRSQSPAPPDHRPAARCLTAHRPDNRQSRPMDRGNPRFGRPQANGRYNSPARSIHSPGPRQPSSGPRFQQQGQRYQFYERPNYQPQGPCFKML